MFNRRVASSCGIPQAMFRSLHIMSRRQASHVLPPLVPLPTQTSLAASQLGSIGVAATCLSLISNDALTSLCSSCPASLSLLQLLAANPLFLQVLTDTMCCSYIVVEHEHKG